MTIISMRNLHQLALVLALIFAVAESSGATKVLNIADSSSYKNCNSLHKAGYNISGVYKIHVNKTQLLVPCEFSNGVGYTIILRRVDNTYSFIQPWNAYEKGFGNVNGNFWLGLAHIYALAISGSRLQLTLLDWHGQQYLFYYSYFQLGPRDQRYRLHIGGYSGHFADDMAYQNGMPFSTYDAPDPIGCASQMKSGWWYNNCAYTLPTGIYYPGGYYHPTGQYYDGIFWKDWYGFNYSMKYYAMAIV